MTTSKQIKAVNLRLREEKVFIKKLLPIFESLLDKKAITTKNELIKKLSTKRHQVTFDNVQYYFYLEFNKHYNHTGYILLKSLVHKGGQGHIFLVPIKNQKITNLDYIKGLATTQPKQYNLKQVQKSQKSITKAKKIIEQEEEKIKPFLYL